MEIVATFLVGGVVGFLLCRALSPGKPIDTQVVSNLFQVAKPKKKLKPKVNDDRKAFAIEQGRQVE